MNETPKQPHELPTWLEVTLADIDALIADGNLGEALRLSKSRMKKLEEVLEEMPDTEDKMVSDAVELEKERSALRDEIAELFSLVKSLESELNRE